jgi:betaine-aldehyde dehydrogenase
MNFTWCGQSCGSTSRAFLHESIYDRVLERIVAAVSAIKPGLPTDDATEMGCLVSRAQFDKVMGYIAAGKADGARLVAGGKKPDDPKLSNGFYIEPAIFAEVFAADAHRQGRDFRTGAVGIQVARRERNV